MHRITASCVRAVRPRIGGVWARALVRNTSLGIPAHYRTSSTISVASGAFVAVTFGTVVAAATADSTVDEAAAPTASAGADTHGGGSRRLPPTDVDAEESCNNRRLITAIELAAHCTRESCWVAIAGEVYDVTSFLASHPGGAGAVLGAAGTDASAQFTAFHRKSVLTDVAAQ